jgi:hypothetical protein
MIHEFSSAVPCPPALGRSAFTTWRRWPAGLVLLGVAVALPVQVACGEPEPNSYPTHFSVKADEKAPVAGAKVSIKGRLVGTTNEAGVLDAQVHGLEGDRLPIKLACPDGFQANPEDSVLILRTVQGLNGEERRAIPHDLGCQPTKRDAVVVVHASGAATSLPVKIDGALVGQTDALGFGHFHVRTDPGSRFEVALDTSANDKLMPQNPKQVFQLGKKDDLFVVDQHFRLPPKAKAPRKHVKAAPKTPIPVRLR